MVFDLKEHLYHVGLVVYCYCETIHAEETLLQLWYFWQINYTFMKIFRIMGNVH